MALGRQRVSRCHQNTVSVAPALDSWTSLDSRNPEPDQPALESEVPLREILSIGGSFGANFRWQR